MSGFLCLRGAIIGLLGSMSVRFMGETSGISSAVSSVKGMLGSLPGPAGLAVGAALGVTAAVIGIGVASVKMAADYEQGLNKVKALTGASDSQMRQYDTGLKQLAIDAGVAPKALTDGLYNVLSASFNGADAMNVLTLATEDAKIGMTSATVTTDALTNVLRSFGVQSKDITRTNGEMLETVTLGKATFEQYATTIVKSASAAVQFHVSMETMNAAWATMTSSGIRAAQASTDFQQSLKVMYGNIGTVTKSLEKNGIAFDETKFNAMSYGDKVVYLNKALQEANDKHVKVTGVTLQAAQAISTISNHIKDYNNNLATLSDKQAMAQKTQQAWAITQNGFNQTMDRVKASIDVLFITIGQQIIPILTKAAQGLVPLIDNFSKWASSSNGLGDVLKQLGTIIQNVWKYLNSDAFAGVIADFQTLGNQVGNIVGPALQKIGPALQTAFNQIGPLLTGTIIPAIDNLVFGLGQFLIWLQSADPKVQLLQDALIGIGVAIAAIRIGAFLATLPALITGFITWGIAAWSAAAGVIAATWPLLAIGAAIAIVVAIIILAVQHWGDITKWLQGAWGAFTGWFMGILGQIGAFFTSVWNGITTGIQAAWNFIVNIVRAGALLVLAVIIGPFVAIGALFVWLYNHNYYFKALIDNIVKVVSAGVAWLRGIWQMVVNWIVARWVLLKVEAEVYWTMLQAIIQQRLQITKQFITSIWNNVVSFLTGIWTNITSKVSQMWTTIVNFFTGAWARINAPLQTIGTNIANFFGNLASTALSWGKNLIQGFINGITGMLGNVGNAVHNVINKVASILGFHSPAKEGPGKELDIWGPNLVKGFSAGIVKAAPILHAALDFLVKPMDGKYPGSQDMRNTPNPSGNSSSSSSGNQDIYIMLDGQVLTHAVSSRQAKLVRLKMGRRAA